MAEKSIQFEQYILRDDEIGRHFMVLFSQKAHEGVKVSLLLDRIGSRAMYGSRWAQNLINQGGIVKFYRPLLWLHIFTPRLWFPRNHTKVMVVDSRIAHIGSVCLAANMADWRDLHARITGPFVNEIARDFSRIWGEPKEQKNSAVRTEGDPDFDYLTARPRLSRSPIYRELLLQINAAKKTIYMATPYFLPPLSLRTALRDAVKRGICVKVILTEQTDVPLAVHVSHSYFPRLLRDGLQLFSYQGTVFHSKYTLIDGQWATMGSVNLDYLSLLENREANIVIRHPDALKELESQFLEDLKHCKRIHPDFWKSVPIGNKIVGYLGRCVKRML